MKKVFLKPSEILSGYDVVSSIYPYVPSLSLWRAWEYAAYQRHSVKGRVLDLGCGDGHYFHLLWPQASGIVGVDMNPLIAETARSNPIYEQVHVAPAHQIPEQDKTFDQVFANCSLEHMDQIDLVLAEVHRCLKPGGRLLCSVVTHRFEQWDLLSNLVAMAGFQETSEALKKDFLSYHHLANPLTPEKWQKCFIDAGLIPEEHIPIVPKYNSGIFLLMDSLWHVKNKDSGEIGDYVFPFLSTNPNFVAAFRTVFQGLLEMETDWQDCSGAVFLVRKVG